MGNDRRNGRLELKYNSDRTQALATIHPPSGGGEAVTATDVLERLERMGVSYGYREQAILAGIHDVARTKQMVRDIVVAQGTVPQDGEDAKVRFHLSPDALNRPLPRRKGGSLPDWFAFDPAQMVTAGQEIATIVPAQPGIPGKTLTWPLQPIPARPGKPASIGVGQNVQISDNGLSLCALHDGIAYLQNATLMVYALRRVTAPITGGEHAFPMGATLLAGACGARITAGDFAAIQGLAQTTTIRAFGDVFLEQAANCEIVAAGDVYVTGGLTNCLINTRRKVIALDAAVIVGGTICAAGGVEAVTLGAADFTATEVQTGVDRYFEVRQREIQEEMAACEANIVRISQTLKPFAALAVHDNLPDDKRVLLQKLQAQKRTQETRLRELHSERRTQAILAKEKLTAVVTVADTVHPGVWIGVGQAATQVESPMQAMRFSEAKVGKSVIAEPLTRARAA